jgi:hypothetical protein
MSVTYLPDIIGLKLELLLRRSDTKEIIVVVESCSTNGRIVEHSVLE